MMEIQDSQCDECAYSQVIDMKSDPIWCRMHQDYFERSDECQDFSNNDFSALKQGTRRLHFFPTGVPAASSVRLSVPIKPSLLSTMKKMKISERNRLYGG